jgi:hypothetical protein
MGSEEWKEDGVLVRVPHVSSTVVKHSALGAHSLALHGETPT